MGDGPPRLWFDRAVGKPRASSPGLGAAPCGGDGVAPVDPRRTVRRLSAVQRRRGDKAMARQKLHPADLLFLQVLLLTFGVVAVPTGMLGILWIAGRI